jgi:hypothetical protein
MSYTFTPEQLNEIKRLADAADLRSQTLGDAKTNYADVYFYIREQIPAGDPATESVRRWLDGAFQANAGVGPFSEFIRSYTER